MRGNLGGVNPFCPLVYAPPPDAWYGDGAGNTVEENSSVFSLIRMR